MSKIHCDICNIDLNKAGFAHHKKTNKHLIEEAKKYGMFDFSAGKIIQKGGIPTEKPILGEISLNMDDAFINDKITYNRLNPNLSKEEKNIKTLELLDDFMKDIKPKPYFVEQLRTHIKTFEKIV